MSNHERRVIIREWLSLFLLALTGISVVAHAFTMVPIQSQMETYFHISNGVTYLASSLFSAFYAFGFLIFGPLSDRFGKKTILVLGLFFLFISTFVLGGCKSYMSFLIMRAVQGIMAATFTPLALAYVFELFRPKHRTLAVSMLSTSFLTATILGQLISFGLTNVYGFSALFYVLACFHLLMAFLLYFTLPPLAKTVKQSSRGHWRSLGRLLKNGDLASSYLISFTQFFAFTALYSSVSSMLGHSYQLSGEENMLFRAVGMVGMLLSLTTNRLNIRFGVNKTIMIGLIMSSVSLLLFALAHHLVFLAVCTIVFVAGITIVLPSIVVQVGQISGTSKGTAMALYTFSLFAGSSVGSLVSAHVQGVLLPYLLCGLLLVVVILVRGMQARSVAAYQD